MGHSARQELALQLHLALRDSFGVVVHLACPKGHREAEHAAEVLQHHCKPRENPVRRDARNGKRTSGDGTERTDQRAEYAADSNNSVSVFWSGAPFSVRLAPVIEGCLLPVASETTVTNPSGLRFPGARKIPVHAVRDCVGVSAASPVATDQSVKA